MTFEDNLFDDYIDDDIEPEMNNGSYSEHFDYTEDEVYEPTLDNDDFDVGEGSSSFTADDEYDSIFSVSGY